MTAISRPLTPKPDRPVEPIALLVIQEIHKASKALGLPVFLVGAMARIILLQNIHGLKPGRATTDVDSAFALDNWDQFRTIKAFLVANARFEESKHMAHRLLDSIKAAANVRDVPYRSLIRSDCGKNCIAVEAACGSGLCRGPLAEYPLLV